jgi:hypothetical protein
MRVQLASRDRVASLHSCISLPVVGLLAVGMSLLVAGCSDDGRGADGSGNGVGAGDDGQDDGGDGGDDGGIRFDIMPPDGGEGDPCPEGGDCEDECEDIVPEPCDDGTNDPFLAIGITCPDMPPVVAAVGGSDQAWGVLTKFGSTSEWDPTHGSAMAVIGSGFIADIPLETPPGDDDVHPTHCNDDLDEDFGGAYDPGPTLPDPLIPVDVGGDCAADPSLVGTGDCSNSIQGQFDQGVSANDYTELRVVATVPEATNSFSYDLAYFTTEYPYYYNTMFNDMYVGWLESNKWTGNISFDEMDNPISLNASFLDFMDDGGNLPEFAGTCMRQHAATKWLTTTAPVVPGEEIIVVFAIFDLSDSILDSYVLLDNWQWGCEGTDKPETKPQG